MATKLNKEEQEKILAAFQDNGNAVMSGTTYNVIKSKLGIHALRMTEKQDIRKMLIVQKYEITESSERWNKHPVKQFLKETSAFGQSQLMGFTEIFAPTEIKKIVYLNNLVLSRKVPKKTEVVPYDHYFEYAAIDKKTGDYYCLLALPISKSSHYVFVRYEMPTKKEGYNESRNTI